MVVDLLGCLDASVPQSIPHVVQRVSLLGVHHPVGNTVPEGVRRHVTRVTTGTVDQVRLDTGLLSNLRDSVPNALGGDPVRRP